MKPNTIYNYPCAGQHVDGYHVGPPHHHHHHHPHPCPPYHGKVGISGRLVLSVKYIDHHGHSKVFDIENGKTYIIEAISETKGKCKFVGRIFDFKSKHGVEKVLQPPHVIDIDTLLVDYSDDYESRLIEIGVNNIISIKPLESMSEVSPEQYHEDNYYINDPFVNAELSNNIRDEEANY